MSGLTDEYYDLAGAIIQSAIEVYQTNSYPPNVSTGFSTPRMESLTFLHGGLFFAMAECVNTHSDYILKRAGVPLPSNKCSCESCREDYLVESSTIDASARYRFCIGAKHHVEWLNGKIRSIFPTSHHNSLLSASEYMEARVGI